MKWRYLAGTGAVIALAVLSQPGPPPPPFIVPWLEPTDDFLTTITVRQFVTVLTWTNPAANATYPAQPSGFPYNNPAPQWFDVVQQSPDLINWADTSPVWLASQLPSVMKVTNAGPQMFFRLVTFTAPGTITWAWPLPPPSASDLACDCDAASFFYQAVNCQLDVSPKNP